MVKKIDTKTRIIEAAIELFYEKGIHWVSFQMIATDVGISQPALYKHFSNKDDLIMSCADYAAHYGRELIDSNLAQQLTARDKLKSYLFGNLKWLEKFPNHGVMVFSIYYFGFNHAPIADLLNKFNQQSEYRIKTRLDLGNNSGEFNVTDTKGAARLIHDVLLGEMIKMMLNPNEFTTENRTETIWKQIEKII